MPFHCVDVNLFDPAAVRQALDKASKQAEKEGKTMTLIRLAYHLGISREVLCNIAKREQTTFDGKKLPEEVIDLLKKAADYCEMCVADAGFAAKNPAMAIFVLKANHSYDDRPPPAIAANTVIFVGEDEISD